MSIAALLAKAFRPNSFGVCRSTVQIWYSRGSRTVGISINSGTISEVRVTTGARAKLRGPMAAAVGKVLATTEGSVTVGNNYAKQNVALTSVGSTTMSWTGIANQNYTGNTRQSAVVTLDGNIAVTLVLADGDANRNVVGSMMARTALLTASALCTSCPLPHLIAGTHGTEVIYDSQRLRKWGLMFRFDSPPAVFMHRAYVDFVHAISSRFLRQQLDSRGGAIFAGMETRQRTLSMA